VDRPGHPAQVLRVQSRAQTATDREPAHQETGDRALARAGARSGSGRDRRPDRGDTAGRVASLQSGGAAQALSQVQGPNAVDGAGYAVARGVPQMRAYLIAAVLLGAAAHAGAAATLPHYAAGKTLGVASCSNSLCHGATEYWKGSN